MSVLAPNPRAGIGYAEPYRLVTPRGRKIRYPFPDAWPGQLEAVDQAMDIIESKGNYVLMNGGTGFGKSPVLMGIASLFESAWLLVGKRDLVEQWKNDYEKFNHVGFLKSRQSFRCTVAAGKTCKDGQSECISKRNAVFEALKEGVTPKWVAAQGYDSSSSWLRDHDCPYIKNRDYSLKKGFTVLTVQMALTIFTHLKESVEGVTERHLLVIDECSEIEDELLRFYESSISGRTIIAITELSDFFDEFTQPRTLEEALGWLQGVEVKLSSWYASNSENPNEAMQDRLSRCGDIAERCRATLQAHANRVPLYFDTEDTGYFRGATTYAVQVKPLEARGLFDRMLGSMADHCVFTSATTGPPELFQDTHRIQRTIDYVEVGTPFPPRNRPIFPIPIGNLSRRKFDTNIGKVTQAIVKIAKNKNDSRGHWYEHAEQKGVIHTYTNKVTKLVVQALEEAGLRKRIVTLSGTGPQRLETFNHFKSSKEPLILVSPSAMLGISLDDDLARWQIIAKMPYANLGDPAVEHRKEHIKGWYSWQTSKNIIQACGRIIRSQEDWGITYILDSCFHNHWQWNSGQFPLYIQQALYFTW